MIFPVYRCKCGGLHIGNTNATIIRYEDREMA